MYNQFASVFTKIMKDKGITQTQLATALQVKQNTVSQWMSGKREPDFDTLIKICILFGVSPTIILNFEMVKDNIKKGFLRDIIGNDKAFQAEQTKLTKDLLPKGLHPLDIQNECEILFNKYYTEYKMKFGF